MGVALAAAAPCAKPAAQLLYHRMVQGGFCSPAQSNILAGDGDRLGDTRRPVRRRAPSVMIARSIRDAQQKRPAKEQEHGPNRDIKGDRYNRLNNKIRLIERRGPC